MSVSAPTTVLHVLDTSIPNLSGYAVRSRYLLEFQQRAGLHPVAVTSDRHRSNQDQESYHGITYYRSHLSDGARQSTARRDLRLMGRLYRDIVRIGRKESVNVVHAHSPVLCGLPAWAAARRLGRPFVYEVRALWEDAAVDQEKTTERGGRYALTRALETFILRRADRIVVICEGLKRDIARRGIPERKLVVVPNGVDVSVFAPRPADQGLRRRWGLSGKRAIGFIGSFFQFEGIGTLLDAAPILAARDPAIRIVIVGGGQEDEELRRLIDARGLGGTVLLIGRVSHEDIPAYYSIMDALVYPRISKRITELVTPLKPLEAMAMEKLVIASDVGGLKELVTDGKTGLLFRAGDAASLAETCLVGLGDPARAAALGRAARAYVERERDWRRIVERHRNLYDGLR
jgi:PEP-CTERM/exosortase A-associated glycosyltransferase